MNFKNSSKTFHSMKKLIPLMLTILFIPALSNAAVIGNVIVPDNLLKWERQADVDEFFKAKMILIYSSEGKEVLVGLPDKGDNVKKGEIASTIIRKLKDLHPDHMDEIKRLNFGGKTWYGIGEEEDGATTYTGFTNYGLTVYQVDIILEAPGIIPVSIKQFLSEITFQRSIEPTEASSFLSKGNLLFDEKKYTKAIEAFNKAVDIDAACPEAYYFRAICYKNLKNYTQARFDLTIALALKNSADFLVEMASVEIADQMFEQAVPWLSKALEIDPENDTAYQCLGEVYDFSGEIDKSISAYEKSISLNPANRVARASLIQLYLDEKKDISTAKKHLQEFKNFQPLNQFAAKLESDVLKLAKESSPAVNTAANSAPENTLSPIKATEVSQSAQSDEIKPPDFNAMNTLVNTGTITTTVNLLKQLYGNLTAEQEATLIKQFEQYYQYPCDEVLEYFRNLNEVLYKAVMLKTRLSGEMEGYGYAAGETLNAYDAKNQEMVTESAKSLLRRRENILSIQRQLAQVNLNLNNMKKIPNALEIKKEREKLFDDILSEFEEKLNKNSNSQLSNSSVEGIWEIDEDILKTVSTSGNNLKRESLKLSNIPKTYGNLIFLQPFVSKKVYIKKIKELGDGYLLVYLYIYNDLLDADDTVKSIVAKSFGNDTDNYNDTYETLIFKRTGENKFILYPNSEMSGDSTKLELEVEGNQIKCSMQIYGSDSYMTMYSYKLHNKGNPGKPATLKNGNWNWDDLTDDYNDELKTYSKLSEKEKQTKFENIDEDNYHTIQWRIALFNKWENEFAKNISSFKGVNPSQADTQSLVWRLEDSKIDKKILINNPDYILELTSDLSSGWIKVWRKEYKTVGESNVSEGEQQLTKRYEVAQFNWEKPKEFIKKDGTWNIQMHNSGLLQTSFKAVLPQTTKFKSSKNGTPGIYMTEEKTLSNDSIDMTESLLSESDGAIELQAKFYNKGSGSWENVKVNYKFKLAAKKINQDDKGNYRPNEADMVFESKEDFYKLQIQELEEDIQNYKIMMEKESSANGKQQVALLILGKEADLQQQKDLLNQLKTGVFHHTITKWDKYNATVSKNKFLEGSRKYQERVNLIEKINMMTTKLREQGDSWGKDWGQKELDKAISAGDNKKMNEAYALLQKRYMSFYEEKQIDAELKKIAIEDYTARAERVKSWSEFGVMAGTMGLTSGATYLYSGYVGITNGLSDGIMEGAKKAIASLNVATMVAESAYDGYNTINPETGKKMGLEGAKNHAVFSLVVIGTCHLAIKGVVTSCSVASKAFNKVRDKLVYDQEREMTKTLIKQYESKIQKFKQLMTKGKTVAAKQEMKMIQEETQKLMANPHAKNILKYNGSKVTNQYYQLCEKKIKEKVVNDFMKRMEAKGWSKFELKEFRNASSGATVGMDWDCGLIEKEGMRLTKGGKAASIEQWQKDATKEFNKAYLKQTGYSAEASFANITSSKNFEAFEDVSLLSNPANAKFEFAESTAKTVKAKADFMLGKHSRGFITKAGKYNEACRGMAKEIRTKLIPNLKTSRFKLHATKGVEYFSKLQNTLERFGKNEIGITRAEREVKNLTGKSLNELPDLISNSLKGVIGIK